ncbi:DUF5347 family protein [Providencia sp. PROV032]|uniref:DUF5347 family protein n=1 Tax=Providencia sp. PROV032 TaxID=2949764 RepID=UPI00234A3E84|nr:DUF5347 family protein [Providencia sp. PROV032]EIL1981757.1 DUF5347 family protein [Providencia rettgeri]
MGSAAMKEKHNQGEKVDTAKIISFQSSLSSGHGKKRKSYDRYFNDGGTIEERTAALNRAAEMKTELLKCRKEEPNNQQLSGFIDYLREQDERILNMIFHLAKLSEKREMKFDDLNVDEQKQLITALNQIKALNALIPNQIAMPI